MVTRLDKRPLSRTPIPTWALQLPEGGEPMRDIRNDLQERAVIAHDQIKAADVHFQRMVEQLRHEHDARVADLNGALAMIAKLMELESRLSGNVVTMESAAAHPSLADRIKAVG